MFRRILAVVFVGLLGIALGLIPGGVASAVGFYHGLMWWNYETGEMSTWAFTSSGVVVGAQTATGGRCDISSGCAHDWRPVAVGPLDESGMDDVLWQNLDTGELQASYRSSTGEFNGSRQLWPCTYGCTLRVGGIGDLNGDFHMDVVAHNTYNGNVSATLLNAQGAITGSQWVSWTCAYQCINEWRQIGVGDFNADGHRDILWYHPVSGQVSAWLLNSRGGALGTHLLSWRCDVASGCAGEWVPSGVGDVDGNGVPDLIWWNAVTGEVSIWLLDANGTVLSARPLDWRCGTGCAWTWRPVGYVPTVVL